MTIEVIIDLEIDFKGDDGRRFGIKKILYECEDNNLYKRYTAAILMSSDKFKKEVLLRLGSAKVKVYGDGIITESDKIALNKIKDTFGVSYSAVYTRLKDLSLFEQHSFEEYCGSVLGFGI